MDQSEGKSEGHAVTRLLQDMSAGEPHAEAELYTVLYDELHRLAAQLMRKERPGHTLQTTALVHEAYERLVGREDRHWAGHTHFMAVAARAMRHVLVDHARRRNADKRGGGLVRQPLDEMIALYEAPSADLLAVDEALVRLEGVDAQLARIIELRFFAGLSVPETASALQVSISTIERGWRSARAFMMSELGL